MNEAIIPKLREWLGEDGISFFSDLQNRFGRVDPVGYLGPDEQILDRKEASKLRGPDEAH